MATVRPAMTMRGQLHELVDAFSELVAQHVRLARMELSDDARFIGARVGVIAALAPLILVGYGFLCVALALTLRRVMAADLAFLLVGLLNLAVGVVGISRAAKQLSGRKVLDASMEEFEASRSMIVPRVEERR